MRKTCYQRKHSICDTVSVVQNSSLSMSSVSIKHHFFTLLVIYIISELSASLSLGHRWQRQSI